MKIQEKVRFYKYGFDAFINIYFFRPSKLGGRVVILVEKNCHPLQGVQNSRRYIRK